MTTTDLIGFFAAFLTTAAFIPQAWMSWKTGRADGVSLGMYLIFTSGVTLWLGYGILIGAWPIMVANFITLLLSLFILVLKIRSGA